MNYRIKTEIKNGEPRFIPQWRFLWWWVDYSKRVHVRREKFKNQSYAFSEKETCVRFLKESMIFPFEFRIQRRLGAYIREPLEQLGFAVQMKKDGKWSSYSNIGFENISKYGVFHLDIKYAAKALVEIEKAEKQAYQIPENEFIYKA